MTDSRAKGARGEREAAKVLTKWTGVEWRRGIQQTRHGGAEGADVEPAEPHPYWSRLHIEVKRGARIDVVAAWRQAARDAEKRGLVPIVLFRADYRKWLVCLDVRDAPRLVDGLQAPNLGTLTTPLRVELLGADFFRALADRVADVDA